MPGQLELRQHLATIAVILRRFGAQADEPTLDEYENGDLYFSLTARLPGSSEAGSPTITLAEAWRASASADYERVEYAYDFVDTSAGRRRAFHGHDPDHFAREFRVLVHEHCELPTMSPAADHYFGLPVDAYEAIEAFTRLWCLPQELACAELHPMTEPASL